MIKRILLVCYLFNNIGFAGCSPSSECHSNITSELCPYTVCANGVPTACHTVPAGNGQQYCLLAGADYSGCQC